MGYSLHRALSEFRCRAPSDVCGASSLRLFRNVRYAFPGTRDAADEVALAPKASDSWPVLAHFNGENVPRAWKFVPVWLTKAFWTRSSLITS